MSESAKVKTGTAMWFDISVENATELRDFYSDVIGWDAQGEDMGGYEDFSMFPPGSSSPAAGVCHAKGVNAGVPPVWLIYFVVEDAKASVAKCVALGGKVVHGPMSMGDAVFCVIQDPAGAHCALFQP